MKARIVRLENTEQGVLGSLVIDGSIFCFTLQPDPTDTHFSIPVGNYLCRRFHGTKWTNTFEIIVPGHTALLFHAGNVEDNSEGCILLGATVGKLKGNRAVLNSGDTFKSFIERTAGVDTFPLEIVNCY